MKTMMEKIVDEVLELVSGPFDIDLRNLKYEDLFADGDCEAEGTG